MKKKKFEGQNLSNFLLKSQFELNKNIFYRKLPQKPLKVVNVDHQNDTKIGFFCVSMRFRKKS